MKPGDRFIVIASDGVWEVMRSAEVIGFIMRVENKDQAAELLVKEARNRWVNINKEKKINNRIGDYPTARRGIDDITVVIGFITYNIDLNPDAYVFK